MVDWSMLPSDILGEIALKLDDPLEDFIYFSIVCHSWNHAASMVKPKRDTTKIMPWLLLAENTYQNPSHLRKLYNINNKRCYQLSMPETFGARCWGSSCGWVVILTTEFQVQLFNPLTKDRITTFPSILNLPKIHEKFEPPTSDNANWYWRNYVERIVVLEMPQTSDLIIAVIYDSMDYLVVARPGDEAWTSIIDDHVKDVVCCGDFIYMVRITGQLRVCDIREIFYSKDVELMEYLPSNRSRPNVTSKVYLVNSGDDLLMVVRHKWGSEDELFPYFTYAFEVYRVDSKSKKWEKIEDFGHFSLFVGYNTSTSIPALKANNLKRSCIYFTDDEHMHWDHMKFSGGHDIGVYDMETRVLTQFYQGDDRLSGFCTPIFFVPNC